MAVHTYTAFGLTIASDVVLPLPPSQSSADPPALRIRKADLRGQCSLLDRRHLRRVEDGDVLCHVPAVATYRVVSAHTILVDAVPTATLASVQLYLLGSVMGVVLHRLNGLVLHGSAIQAGRRALVCVGPSGIGKSTLALAFSQAGYRVLADDIAVVRCSPGESPRIVPGYPQMKLWRQSLELLGLADDGLISLPDRGDKYTVPVETFCHSSVRLGAVYAVETHDNASGVSIQDVSGAGAYPLIHNNTYRIDFLSVIADPRQHFEACSRLLNHVPIRRLVRSAAGCDPQHMVRMLLDDFHATDSHVTP